MNGLRLRLSVDSQLFAASAYIHETIADLGLGAAQATSTAMLVHQLRGEVLV